jgi:hypothetical protein
MKRVLALCAIAALLGACSERDAPVPLPDRGPPTRDGGPVSDGGIPFDGGTSFDGGPDDDGGAAEDGGATDGGGGSDGGPEDGGPARDGGISVPDGGPGIPCETGGATAESEPNDTPGVATRLSVARLAQGKINPSGDEDWYLFDACGEALLEIELSLTGDPNPRPDGGAAGGSAVDPRVDVIGPDGTTLLNWQQDRAGEDGPSTLRLVAYIERAGPLYLRVTDVGGDEAEPDFAYSLRVTTAPVPDADIEPNGNKGPTLSASLATPLTENVIAQAYLASARDEDWYRIPVPGLRIVDVVVTDAPATGTPLRYRLRLFAPDAATEIARAQAAAPGPTRSVNFRLSAQVATAGDYFAVVSDQGDAWDAVRPYRVFFMLRSVPDSAVEPNDRPAQAYPVASGAPLEAYLSTGSDEDWFSILSPQKKILRAELTLPSGVRTPVDYRVTVFGPDGVTQLAQSTDFDGLSGDVQVTALAFLLGDPRPYYVALTDWRTDDGDTATPYRLVAALLDVPDGATEPNDTPQTATPATPGQTLTGYIASQRDRDYYSVTVAAGQTLRATLSAGTTPVQYRLSLFDRQGGRLGGTADVFDIDGRTLPNDLAASYLAAEPGTYFVGVEDLGGDDADLAVPYSLTITLTGP